MALQEPTHATETAIPNATAGPQRARHAPELPDLARLHLLGQALPSCPRDPLPPSASGSLAHSGRQALLLRASPPSVQLPLTLAQQFPQAPAALRLPPLQQAQPPNAIRDPLASQTLLPDR
ncbi:MAG TPA: hypothetical protein VNN62_09645 [Methylomirabilota bacterium]|nr:hypothetical protein [Methylomirabilota bacterium]